MATKSTTAKKARAKGRTATARGAKKTTKKTAKKPPVRKKAAARRPAPRSKKAETPATAPVRVQRRVIFVDVENTSSEASLVDVVEHLQIDRVAQTIQMVAVGNWKSVGARVARRLAALGARLVHSAPSPGVRDWSDLAIAVAAGQWLATAETGDVLEIVSDDRAFDAVGDAAATAGIVYRRISHRTLAAAAPAAEAAPSKRPRRRGRRGRGGTKVAAPETAKEEKTGAQAPSAAPAKATRRGRRGRGKSQRAKAETPKATAAERAAAARAAEEAAHTASHDQIISVLKRLSAARGSTTLDALANALRDEGFTRPPGSPRLVVRLRRLKDVEVSPSGIVRLATHEEKPAGEADSAG